MISRTPLVLLVVGLLTAPAPPAHAQETDGAEEETFSFAGSYWTFGGLYRTDNNEYDLMAFGGQTWPFGEDGGWTLRAGLGAGVSFYGLNDTGFIGGPQLTLERVLSGDRIQLNDGRPLELYALVGGGAYAGWNLAQATDQTKLVPAVSGGLGVRWRGAGQSDPMVTLELYREERFSGFDSRLFIRFDYMRPRGVAESNRPSSERP